MLRDLALQAMVVTMMLAVGLQLAPAELAAGLRRRWLICCAVLANLAVMPALALAVGELLALPDPVRVGLLVCAAAPGGPTGPVFARLARADLGVATALQVLLGVLALVSAPLTLELLGHADGPPLLGPMAATLAVYQLLPLTLALLLRRWRPTWAARLAAPVGRLANILLLIVVIGMVWTRGPVLGSQGPGMHAAALVMVICPLVFAGAWRAGAGRRSTLVAVGLVTAVRNMSVALLLSAGFFARTPEVDAVILVWSFYMLVIPGLFAWRRGAGTT